MKKLFRKIMATVITVSMALSAVPAFAADDGYINIYNSQGIFGGAPNDINRNVESSHVVRSDGFGSKPANDNFAAITAPATTKIHLYNNTNITWDDANKTRFFVVEMDFVPVAGIKEVRLWQTSNHLSQAFDLSGANKKDWNHIKFEIDLSTNRIGVELNGEKVRDTNLAQLPNWERMPQIRIQFESDGVGDTAGNMVLYSDNIKMYTTDTADEVFMNDGFTYNLSSGRPYTITKTASKSYVSGAGGKAVNDSALDIVMDGNDTYLGINIPVKSKYVKVQYNIMPKENFNLVYNQARNTVLHYNQIGVTDSSTESHRRMLRNQWNKVELLLENKTGYIDTTEAIEFTTEAYANGFIASASQTRGKNQEKEGAANDVFPLRIRVDGANAEFMIDDLKIMTSDTTPFTIDGSVGLQGKAKAIAEPTQIANGTVSAYDTTKVSDFSADGATVRVFTDKTYNKELAETDVLSVGNVIVTEDSNKRIKYYDVTEVTQDPALQPINVDENYDNQSYGVIGTPIKGNGSFVSGVAGKASEDYSMKIDKITTSGAPDVYLEYQAVPSAAEFITVEYNILPDQYLSELYLGTRASNAFGNVINGNALIKGRWNNIKYIFKNPDTSKTAIGDSCNMTADIYINGKCIVSNGDAAAKLTEYGKYQIRFVAIANENTSPMTLYYDDIRIKTYTSMPSADVNIPELIIDPNCGMVDNDARTILAYSGTVLDDIDTRAFNIVAYTDNTFTEQVTGTGELSVGNIIVISSTDKDMFYYTVVPGSMTIDLMEFAYSSDNTSYADASKTDIKNGYYKYTVTASNTTNDNKNVTAIIALYNSADKLENVAVNTLNIPSGSTATEVSALLQITNAAAGMKIKTFVWDTLENAKPYETDPIRILVIGNSITQHGASSSLGWNGTWGMAASAEDKDYVHQLIAKIKTKTTDYEIMYRNISEFEKYFYDFGKFVTDNYKDLADFDADIIIATFGANCNNSNNEVDPEYNAPYAFSAAYYENIINFFNVDGNAKVIAGKTVLTTNAVLSAIDAAAALHPEWKLVDMTSYTGDEYNATSYYKSYPDVFASNIREAVIGHPGDKAMEAMANDLWRVLPDIMDSVR